MKIYSFRIQTFFSIFLLSFLFSFSVLGAKPGQVKKGSKEVKKGSKESVSKKKSLKKTKKSFETLVWKGADHFFRFHFALTSSMLLEEGKDSFAKPSAQLRIQWNAASVGRITKAYEFYISGLSKHFPLLRKRWSALLGDVSKLKKAASAMRNDALQGSKGKVWGSLLLEVFQKSRKSLLGLRPKYINDKQIGFLLGIASGLGAGGEMLSYFRLRQIKFSRDKKVKRLVKNELDKFSVFINKNNSFFRKLKKRMPTAKWIPLFLYHTALLIRAGSLFRKSLDAKKKRKQMINRYKKRMTQLKLSLKKVNSSFKHIWRQR